MKAVILAGGLGSRMAASGESLPKPIVPVGGWPLIGHLMRYLAAYGFDTCIVALGHHQKQIRQALEHISIAQKERDVLVFEDNGVRWQAHLVDTGEHTQTGGRLGRLRSLLPDTFLLAYSDGLMDVDLGAMLAFHRGHGRMASVLAIQPPARFGTIRLDQDSRVIEFKEKQIQVDEWINGGLFLLESAVLDRVDDDKCRWEYDVLPLLAGAGELMAWPHSGFWQCIDYAHEVTKLDALCQQGSAPWIRKKQDE